MDGVGKFRLAADNERPLLNKVLPVRSCCKLFFTCQERRILHKRDISLRPILRGIMHFIYPIQLADALFVSPICIFCAAWYNISKTDQTPN